MKKTILICDACEEALLASSILYHRYQHIVSAWAHDSPYIRLILQDGRTNQSNENLEHMGLIVSTECDHDKVQILPRNCPHITGE